MGVDRKRPLRRARRALVLASQKLRALHRPVAVLVSVFELDGFLCVSVDVIDELPVTK